MTTLLLALAMALGDDAEALEKFKTDIKGKDAAGRSAAIEELAKTKSPKICVRLASMLTNEVVEVRCAAAKGLGTQDDKKRAIPLLVAAVQPNAKEPLVVAAIVSALGKLGDEAGVAEINKHVSHENLDVAKAAVDAAGEIRSASSFEPLIKSMKECEEILKPRDRQNGGGGFGRGGFGGPGGNMQNFREMRERAQMLKPEIQKVLVAMAKVNCQDAQDWELWWKENRAKYKPEKPS
jgi:HEAT repeat protein